MPVRVGINGFGRIGRTMFRAAQESHADIEVVAVNDITDAGTLAHLLKYDSVFGPFPGTVEVRDGALAIDGREVKVLAERDPSQLPWSDLGVEVVIESTGLFTKRDGAAKAIGLVVPELQGKMTGFAVRAPVPTGSVVDLTIDASRETSVDEINEAFRSQADTGAFTGILQYTDDPIVSSDIVKSPFSSIFDSQLTAVLEGTMVKVVAWYDNEWGYSNRCVELAQKVLVRAHA